MEVNNLKLGLDQLRESKEYEQTRQAVEDLVYSINCMCDPDNSDEYPITDIVEGVKDFLRRIPRGNMKKSMRQLLIFQFWKGTQAIFSLFTSPIKGNKERGEESIRLFLINPKSGTGFLPHPIQNQCALIVLQFINLLNADETDTDDDECLYYSCRETLLSILKSIAFANRSTYFAFTNASLLIRYLFPIIDDLSRKLRSSLFRKGSNCSRTSFARNVREFTLLSLRMRGEIEEHVRYMGQSLPLCVDEHFSQNPCFFYEIYFFYEKIRSLSRKLMVSLPRLSEHLQGGAGRMAKVNPIWSYYLPLMKELNEVFKLFQGAESEFSSLIEECWLQIDYFIMHSKRIDEHQWILDCKKGMNFESRRDMMMSLIFPVVTYEEDKLPKMHIDRSHLLTESYEQIAHTNPKLLHNGLFVVFKNEESTGQGVSREWLLLVCQHLFDPQNSLFVACPHDLRRFFPNPAKTYPERLNYFRFCGRMLALALLYKVHVGIAFDRMFFLQLAGKEISLEDIRNADPCMYKSCKEILEMDADRIDSDLMGLTFVNEIEELGSQKVVELCPGGNTIVVNSNNREEYVNLLIRHCFVKSISAKVASFAQGFGDILRKQGFQKFFFRSLELEDLDSLLLGNDKGINVEDWKAHTDYYNYNKSDEQICWFWKVVESMSMEQQRELLFFWTSVKYLPVNGFSGLPSRLYMYKSKGCDDHLPSSHTCFYRLGLPVYSSPGVMQQNIYRICQDYKGCGFGLQ